MKAKSSEARRRDPATRGGHYSNKIQMSTSSFLGTALNPSSHKGRIKGFTFWALLNRRLASYMLRLQDFFMNNFSNYCNKTGSSKALSSNLSPSRLLVSTFLRESPASEWQVWKMYIQAVWSDRDCMRIWSQKKYMEEQLMGWDERAPRKSWLDGSFQRERKEI